MRLVVGAAVVGASLLAVAAMRLSPLFAALLLCLALLPTRAAADGTATTLDDCLAAGDVWLLVIDDADTTRAIQCVGTPESGEAALAAGGMSIGYGKRILICTLDGYPDRCPSASSGHYWTYFHADADDAWDYSDSGAHGYRPPPQRPLRRPRRPLRNNAPRVSAQRMSGALG